MTVVTAFDADVLIYAVSPTSPYGMRIRQFFEDPHTVPVGSVLLLPEVLAKPRRRDSFSREVAELESLLSRISLLPLDRAAGQIALEFATRYRLRGADATHLATAVIAGADQFLTTNRKDFPQTIAEITVVYPEDLPHR